MDGVLRQPGIGAPGLMAVVIERSLGIEAPAGVRRQQQHHPPHPSLPDRPHFSAFSMREKKRPGSQGAWRISNEREYSTKIASRSIAVLDPGFGFAIHLWVEWH